MNKEDAKRLQEDYIPNGESVKDVTILNFRKTLDDEIYQCGMQIDNDIQSGPIYCGGIAQYIAIEEEGIVAVCKRHAKYLDNDSLKKIISP
jgi:hypothetical protein